VQAIDEIETSADKITHETIALLHTSFNTPLDRDEIHQLIMRMDDILDLIQDFAEAMYLYDIRQLTPEARQLSDIVASSCERVKSAVVLLNKMDNAPAMLKLCREIDQLESDADRAMRTGITKLFRDEADVRQLIKMKGIYELLESVTDRARTSPTSSRASSSRIPEPGRTPAMQAVEMSLTVIVVLVLLALAFDFMNGFHDAANSIATIVSTGVLKPQHAVAWAAFFNVAAIAVFQLKVASTIGKGTIDPAIVDHYVVFGALIGAIAWNIITWYYGIPSSSSHALIGGLAGAAMAKAGTGSLVWAGIGKVVAFILVAPFLGFILGGTLMVVVSWLANRSTPRKVDKSFRRLQLCRRPPTVSVTAATMRKRPSASSGCCCLPPVP
jgi:uncharacterized protein Yka (UPF0111/DUF47 family)